MLPCYSLHSVSYFLLILSSLYFISPNQFSSVAQSCLILCNPMNCSTPGFVHHQLLESAQTLVHQVGDAIHLILCCPLLLLPSTFRSIRVFSNESVLWIRWPKYWSFSFSISPSNEYSGLVSFRIDWFDFLTVPIPQWKNINSLGLSFLYDPTLTSIHDYWKNKNWTRQTFVGNVMSLLSNMLSR